MRTVLLIIGFALATVLSGCDESAIRTPGGASGNRLDAAGEPSGAPVALGGVRANEGVSCNGQVVAPPLPADALYGDWSWQWSYLYEDGREYDAQLRGNLVITSDGRWDGERATMQHDGTFSYPTAFGPGNWTFDSRSLTLEFDDGSDAETYTGVRVSDQQNDAGELIKVLTLEVADETGDCTVYIAGRLR